MRFDADDYRRLPPWVGWLESLTPLFLAAHGWLLLRESPAQPVHGILVGAAALLGVAGLAGWQSISAIRQRAWLMLLLTWALLYFSGGVTAFFTLWYFMLAAVYPLVLGGIASFAYPILLGVAYLGLLPFTPGELVPAAVFGRAAVITAIGLVVAGISSAQRRANRDLVTAKNEFIASVSHELRTPLTAVVGFADILHRRADTLEPAEIEEFAGAVGRHSMEVTAIVEDLLVAARAGLGRVSVIPAVLDMRNELDWVVGELLPLFGLSADRLEISGSSVLAWADATRVRQILRNLVVNSVRHGGSRIEARVAIDGDLASIELADDGNGIPDADVGRLFMPYQRFQQNGTQPDSIGLGLAVSRTLARLMAGDLTYHRRDGWSVFRLELPAAEHRAALSAT